MCGCVCDRGIVSFFLYFSCSLAQSCTVFATPWAVACQALLSMKFLVLARVSTMNVYYFIDHS